MYGTKLVDDRPTLIYCRESRDENSEHYERIETQRDILVEFCRRTPVCSMALAMVPRDDALPVIYSGRKPSISSTVGWTLRAVMAHTEMDSRFFR